MEISRLAAKDLGSLAIRLELLPDNIRDPVHEVIKSAEFRSCGLLIEQCHVLRCAMKLSFAILALLFEQPRTSLHRAYKTWEESQEGEEQPREELVRFSGPNATLSLEEEEELLNWVAQRQRAFDCPTLKDLLEQGTEILHRRSPTHPELDRTWWKSFKKRYSDRLSCKFLDSREFARANVRADDVFRYFGEVVQALQAIVHPKQVVNMDESGFSSRIDKGRRKKCLFCPDLTVEPRFQEERNSTQLSYVAAVNLAGEPLMPMFITKERVVFNQKDLQMIQSYVKCVQSPRGYMNEETMGHWIDEIWKPYCDSVRAALGKPDAPMFLIMDNCPSHCTQNIMQKFTTCANTRLIWLPPHSSHFLQPLDASYFAVLKAYYRSFKTLVTTPRVSGKVLRAFRAAWTASFPPNIFRCWELVGFMYENIGTNNMRAVLNMDLVLSLIRENCQDHETVDDDAWDSGTE